MKWIYIVMIFLTETWSLDPGTNDNTPMNSTSSDLSEVYVHRQAVFSVRSNIDMTCGNKTWNETMFVIWSIQLKHNSCRISFSNLGENENSCNDGKSLQNTSSSQSYLHIPNFSPNDVGIYKCESVYSGGIKNYIFNITITVPPTISAWWEHKNNTVVAVCRAERGSPATNISWSHSGNQEHVSRTNASDGSVTVESRLKLPEAVNQENLSCIVRHQFWAQERYLLVPSKHYKKDSSHSLHYTLVVVVIVAFMVGLLLFALKKPIMRGCQRTQESTSKPSGSEDVEEVEPYASYIQRVNSIYN